MARDKAPQPSVGRNVDRTEGRDKVTGAALYIDDMSRPDMVWGATVRSTIARGRIRSVERDPAFDWAGFTVVDHRDVPASGRNIVALIADDQPYLAVDRVNHQGEAIMLLAHPDRARLDEGVRHVNITYDEQDAVLDLRDATQLLKEIAIKKGDLDAGFAAADLVIEGTYATGAQEHLYIEPNGMIAEVTAEPGGEGSVTVWGSLQCPHYAQRALCVLFGLPASQVRVVQTTTGGGFGGKEEFPSVIAGHAALLALKAKRPVKLIYDRHEDLVATTKRHPSITRHRTGVKRDGTLTAMDIDVRLDGGAYVTLSPVVLSRGAIHACGPYRVPHVHVRGQAFLTNTPPAGAFRGFGAPQSQFAVEVHMDRIAERLGLDPVELRRRNVLRVGDTTATGQRLRSSVSAEDVLDRALALHSRRLKKLKKPTKKAERDLKARGIGLAMFFHGSGFTGAGEVKLAARAGLRLKEKGVEILVGSTEIGQGTRTMLAQIVADAMALPFEWVETSDPDTARVPDSGPTVASRTCMVVGGILQRAAARLRGELGDYDSPREFRRLAATLLATRDGNVVVEEQYEKPADIQWNDETYEGDAYAAYAWGCNIAEVEVDPLTYQARCTHLVSVIDIGKAIHPRLAEGQIEGGSLQAVGWALYEDVVMQKGRMQNAQMTNYIIPTTLDTPPMDVEIVENPFSGGPYGAKGVGECPIDGPAPAIANAIRNATGAHVDEIPATPERVMKAVERVSR